VFSDEFGRLLTRAGLPRSVLHEARHTTLSLMAKRGVSLASFPRGRATTTPASR
jgi:hypothetical protein